MMLKNKRMPLLSRAEVTQPASVSPEINNLIKEIGCRKVIIAKDEGTLASRLKQEADMEFAQARLAELQARCATGVQSRLLASEAASSAEASSSCDMPLPTGPVRSARGTAVECLN